MVTRPCLLLAPSGMRIVDLSDGIKAIRLQTPNYRREYSECAAARSVTFSTVPIVVTYVRVDAQTFIADA